MRTILLAISLLTTQLLLAQNLHLFIGTYTGTGSKGIYVYRFDAATGKATWLSNTDSVSNPSFLALAPNGKTLYACTEDASRTGGNVSAFGFDEATGQLSFINSQPTGGDHPCYVAVDKTGKWVTVGNYSGGSVTVFPTATNGSLKPYSQLMQHQGAGVNKQRQEKAHVHATVFSPKQDYLYAPDLGMDKVVAYRFTASLAKPLIKLPVADTRTTPGSGPRHLTFHPNNKWAYLMEEMSGAVSAYRYLGGKLVAQQRIAAHPDTVAGPFGSADIHVSPDGKFLYASNRAKENNLAIFKINATTGLLTTVGYQSTLGMTPRNFCIDPTGGWLLAANQETSNIAIFKRDKTTGLLTPTGEEIKVPKPVCLIMK